MTRMTIDSAVTVDGREDATQLEVQGHTTQTEPLQAWQDASGEALAKVSGDGRLQVGNFNIDPPPPSALVEANDDITLPSARPKRAWQSLGQLTGALNDAVAWVAHELHLLGSGEVTGLHAALRSFIRYDKSGVTSDGAELRAGDFLAANDAGTVGKVVGVKAAVTNSGDDITTVAAFEASVVNEGDGDIAALYGVRVDPPVNSGSGEITRFYAVDAGGPLQILEQSDSPNAEAAGKGVVYAKDDGTLHYKSFGGTDHDLTAGGFSGALEVENASGDTAVANDVGFIDADGAYRTTSTPNALVSWCVVLEGAASGNPITVARRGTVTVAYTGDDPATGDYLVTSAASGRAQRSTVMRPEVFARCVEAGAQGAVRAILLCNRQYVPIYANTDFYGVETASDSDFQSTIASISQPPGGDLVYGAVTAGSEDTIEKYDYGPDNTLAKLVLHNTTRGEQALVLEVDVANNTITLTDTVPGSWQQNDVITARSQTNTGSMGGGTVRYFDLEIDRDKVPENATELFLSIYALRDTGGATYLVVHPWMAYDVYRYIPYRIVVGNVSHCVELLVVPLIDRKLTVGWNATGVGTINHYWRLVGAMVAVP